MDKTQPSHANAHQTMPFLLTNLPINLIARILEDRWTSVWEMNTVSNATKKLHEAMKKEKEKVKLQRSLAAASITEILSQAREHFATPRQLTICEPYMPDLFHIRNTDNHSLRGRVRIDMSQEFNHGFYTKLLFSCEVRISHDSMDRIVMVVPATDKKGFMFVYVNDEGRGTPFGGERLMYSTVGYHKGIAAAIKALGFWDVQRE